MLLKNSPQGNCKWYEEQAFANSLKDGEDPSVWANESLHQTNLAELVK